MYISTGCNVSLQIDDSQKTILDLKISLGFIATLLVLLGPCGCVCLGRFYKDRLHQRCTECWRKTPMACCKDYRPIDENVDHNKGNEQINQPA